MSDVVKTKKAVTAAQARERKAAIAKKAYKMRMAGVKWWDIAEELKITEAAARKTVAERIAEVAETIDYYERREFLSLELDRLDALQAALWDEAMEGKVSSVTAVLAIMDRRAKWLGFAEPVQQQAVTSNTIVIPGNTSDYVKALQRVRAEIEAA
jgi:orotate phosphoribosyltransferase-like protein